MAKAGRLRLRDGRLVVEEAFTGEVIAEVEPDENMRIDTTGLISAMLTVDLAAELLGAEVEGAVQVTWYQRVGPKAEEYIDAEAVDVTDAPRRPIAELEERNGD